MDGDADLEDRPVAVHSDEVPVSVRQAVLRVMADGDTLWRGPRLGGTKGWFGSGKRYLVIEWWLIDSEGELIEAFWEV